MGCTSNRPWNLWASGRLVRLVCLVCLLLPGCFSMNPTGNRLPEVRAQRLESSPRPAWTCAISPSDQLVAIGSSPAFVFPEQTLEAACDQALDQLARSSLALVSSRVNVLAEGRWELGLFDHSVLVPEEIEARVRERSHLYDVWLDPKSGEGWCLAGMSRTMPRLIPRGDCSRRPQWIDHVPQEPGWIHAVGMSQAWADPHRGRVESAEQALAELSRIIGSSVQGSLVSSWGPGTTTLLEVRNLSSSAVLMDSQIVAWWQEPESGDWYSLARMPGPGNLQQPK